MSETTKHTPGPWKSGQKSLNIYTDNGEHIVDTRWHPRFADGEQQANAKLIAAAPDLLHACVKLKQAARAMPKGYQHFIMTSIIEAELAIFKASGQ